MNQNKRHSFNSDKPQVTSNKFLVPILAIIILVLVVIVVSWPRKEKLESVRLPILDNTKVEVVNGDGTIPSSLLPEKNQGISNSPQQGPATVEDLGGGNTSSSTEDLLKDKEIEVK